MLLEAEKRPMVGVQVGRRDLLMPQWLRWPLAAVVLAHGLVHLLGAVKGLGSVAEPGLAVPIGPAAGWACPATSAAPDPALHDGTWS